MSGKIHLCLTIIYSFVSNFIFPSDNKLAIPEIPSSLKAAFSNLIQLQMSNMDYTWKNIVQASAMWPMLIVLAVSGYVRYVSLELNF